MFEKLEATQVIEICPNV